MCRYSVDCQLYRARLVTVVSDPTLAWVASVRYIDYGNYEARVSATDIFPWDPLLSMVPAQATLCCFHGAPHSLGAGADFTREVLEDFQEVMTRAGPYRLEVHKRLQPSGLLFQAEADISLVEVEVSLYTRSGTDMLPRVLDLLKLQLPLEPPCRQPPSFPLISQPFSKVPYPHHLEGEDIVQVCPSQPPTPPHPSQEAKTLTNVNFWLQKWKDEQQNPEAWLDEPGGREDSVRLQGNSSDDVAHGKMKRDIHEEANAACVLDEGHLARADILVEKLKLAQRDELISAVGKEESVGEDDRELECHMNGSCETGKDEMKETSKIQLSTSVQENCLPQLSGFEGISERA